MSHPRRRGRILGLLAVLILLAIAIAWATKQRSGAGHHEERRIEFQAVNPNDLRVAEEWARQRCQGNSVEKLASALGLEPRLEVVVAYIARSFPPKTRAIVEEVCRAELARSTG